MNDTNHLNISNDLSHNDTLHKIPALLRGTMNETQNIVTDDDDFQNATREAVGTNGNLTVTNDTDINDDICSLVAQRTGGVPFTTSVSHLWTRHFDNIVKASQHPSDPNYLHKEWIVSLLASLTPSMLQQGFRTKPSSVALERVLTLVRQRILNPHSTRPIKIAVVGGSVTGGGGCNRPPIPVEGHDKNAMDSIKNAMDCAWPKRLELLVNNLVGMQLVQVHNLAVGGTHLELPTPLIKYWLYPQELLPNGPDVIISSYSTNEQHTYPYRIDTTNTTKFAEIKRKRVNDFIETVHNSRPCDEPPFLMFLDDYLGNQQDRIVGETTYNKIVSELAEWYGDVMHVSYADVVRRVVYANTEEITFTPDWPIEKRGEYKGQHVVQPHFGMGGHVTIAWTLVFALGQAIAGCCENQHFLDEMARLKRQTMIPDGVTELMTTVPPPRLTTDLMLSNVTQAWRDNFHMQQGQRRALCSEDTYGKAPCSFAFIAGQAGTVRNGSQLTNYLKRFGAFESDGWGPVVDLAAGGWSKKLGLVASKAGANMTVTVANIDKEIRVLNLQTLKSYGDKWEGSKARFTVRVQNPGKPEWIDTFVIEGVHDSKTR